MTASGVPRRTVALHCSLVGRLLATSVVIAVAAIASTAWLATQTTSRAIRQEQGRSLADDKSVYDMVVSYAATHRDWAGIQHLIEARAADIDRRITLMSVDREVIADSKPGVSLAGTRVSAAVDPLRLDPGLIGGADGIDARAVGPYRLPEKERAELRTAAEGQLKCMASVGINGVLQQRADGRPTVRATNADTNGLGGHCAAKFRTTTATEDRALAQLATMTGRCLGLSGRSRMTIDRDFAVLSMTVSPDDRSLDVGTARTRACLRKARVDQLRPYVAPPALLFVTDPDSAVQEPVFSLSRANILRILGVTGGVLFATVLITVVTGRRLIRPLRALTEAAAQPLDRFPTMPVTRHDEIGYLARALNDLNERRARAEAQRRRMVSDIAHELRNPLTNIRAWLEAVQDGVVRTGPAVLDLLHDEASVLHHIIDDLSDLAAADAGTLRIHREPVHVRDVLAQVLASQSSTASSGRITLALNVEADPVAVVDPVRLRQMVGNLLSNAIRYTPAGGTVRLTAAAGDDLTVVVSDTGIGIVEADLPHIFDRFWRADSSRARATGGSGLGLPIARQLAEAHGGTLTARSRPGEGTTMTLRLPLSR